MVAKRGAALALAALLATPGLAQEAGLSLAPVPEGPAHLTVWTFLPGNYEAGAEAYAEAVASFQASHPNVTVDLVDMPYPSYFDAVRNAILAQDGPDVITMYGAAQAFSYRAGLYPLQGAIAPELEGKLLFLQENFSSDGNLYILPTGQYGYAVLANRDLFAQAGLEPAQALASWPGLLQACQSLTAAGITPFAAGWHDGYLLETFVYMISSQMMDKAALGRFVAGEGSMQDGVFTATLGHVLEMRDAGCFGDEGALGRNMFDDTTNQYMAGQAAMLAVGSINTAKHAASGQGNSTVLALPMVPDAANPPMIDAGAEAGWAVTRWTKAPEAALAFVTHMASPGVQAALGEKIDVPPNIAGAGLAPSDPIRADYMALLARPGNHTGFAAFPLTVLAVIERSAVPLMSGSMTADDLARAMQGAFLRSK